MSRSVWINTELQSSFKISFVSSCLSYIKQLHIIWLHLQNVDFKYKSQSSSLICSVQIQLCVSIKSALRVIYRFVPAVRAHPALSPVMQRFEDLHNDLSSIPLHANTIRLLSVYPLICLKMPADCICAFLCRGRLLIKMAVPLTAVPLKISVSIFFV